METMSLRGVKGVRSHWFNVHDGPQFYINTKTEKKKKYFVHERKNTMLLKNK